MLHRCRALFAQVRRAAITVFFVLIGVAAGFGPAQAQSTNWDGSASTDWFDSTNWSAGVPTSSFISTGTIDTTTPNPTVIATPGAVAGTLEVGETGTGRLTIQGGGTLNVTNNTIIGDLAGSLGTVIVTGAGSILSAGGIVVGSAGNGSLTIGDGGTVNVNTPVVVANSPGSIGNLNIGAAPGDAPVAPGTLNVLSPIAAVSFGTGAGAGAVNFNHTSTDYTFGGIITNDGEVNVLAGTTALTGANSYTGGTTIASTAGSPGVLVISSDNNLGAPTGPLTFNGGTLRLNANMNLASTRTITTDAGGGNFDTNGFNSTISQGITGIGAFLKVGDGTLTLDGVTNIAGGVGVGGGILRAGAADIFTGAGGVAALPGGTLDLAGFNQTVTNVINAGLIETGGTGNTNLTVTGIYTGVGNNTLALNTFLGADGSPSDKLVLSGATATTSGSSRLGINNIGGLGAQTVGPGILVVDAINGATTTPGAFSLAGPVVAGPFEYMLFRGDGNPDAWYLRSTLDCSLDPTNPDCASPGPGPAPERPNYRQEVSLYAAIPSMALQYGRTLLDTLHQRVGQQGNVGSFGESSPYGAWGRVIGTHGKQDGDPVGIYNSGPEYDYTFWAFQAGTDLYRATTSEGGRDRAGTFFAVGGGQGDVTHVGGVHAGDDSFQGYSFGGYWTHYTPDNAYVDAVAMGTWYDDMKGQSTRLPALHTNGSGFAASVEGGYPLPIGGGFVAEPQIQLAYQVINIDNSQDIAATVHFDNVDSLVGRLGVRFFKTWTMAETGLSGFYDRGLLTAWLRPSVWNEFRGDPKTQFSSEDGFIPFRSDIGGATFELNSGLTAQVAPNAALYGIVNYQTGLERDGFAYGGELGLKVAW